MGHLIRRGLKESGQEGDVRTKENKKLFSTKRLVYRFKSNRRGTHNFRQVQREKERERSDLRRRKKGNKNLSSTKRLVCRCSRVVAGETHLILDKA